MKQCKTNQGMIKWCIEYLLKYEQERNNIVVLKGVKILTCGEIIGVH